MTLIMRQHVLSAGMQQGRDKMLESRAATQKDLDRNAMKFIKNKIKIFNLRWSKSTQQSKLEDNCPERDLRS